jgi:hypothetical protein
MGLQAIILALQGSSTLTLGNARSQGQAYLPWCPSHHNTPSCSTVATRGRVYQLQRRLSHCIRPTYSIALILMQAYRLSRYQVADRANEVYHWNPVRPLSRKKLTVQRGRQAKLSLPGRRENRWPLIWPTTCWESWSWKWLCWPYLSVQGLSWHAYVLRRAIFWYFYIMGVYYYGLIVIY